MIALKPKMEITAQEHVKWLLEKHGGCLMPALTEARTLIGDGVTYQIFAKRVVEILREMDN